MQTLLANTLWYLSCLPRSLAWKVCARNVADTQAGLLRRLLQRNSASAYGRQYQFAAIRSIAEFQRRVPLTAYDDYQSWIERIAAGEPNVLTSQPVQLLEPTSGSIAAHTSAWNSSDRLLCFIDGVRPAAPDSFRI